MHSEVRSIIIQNRGDRDPSKQDLVAMVSGATGATKQEVEGALAEYTSRKTGAQRALTVRDENALTQRNVKLYERTLTLMDHVGRHSDWYAILGVALGGVGIFGLTISMIVPILVGPSLGMIALGTGIAAACAYAYFSSGFNDKIFEKRYRVIELRQDIGHKEKEFLQRKAFANWYCRVAGLENEQDEPETGAVFYNSMTKMGMPIYEGTKYLRTIIENAKVCYSNYLSPEARSRYSPYVLRNQCESAQVVCAEFIAYIREKRIPCDLAMHALETQEQLYINKRAITGELSPVEVPVKHAIRSLEMSYGPGELESPEFSFGKSEPTQPLK